MDLHQIDWENMPWEPVREGIERKAFSGAVGPTFGTADREGDVSRRKGKVQGRGRSRRC